MLSDEDILLSDGQVIYIDKDGSKLLNIFLLQDGGGIVRFLFSLERRIDGEKTNYKLDAVLIPTTGCIEVNKFMLLGLYHQNK